MHYYKRNIGDYAKKAARLSMLQHGAYTLLIDSCYDREIFPTLDEAIEWCWASTDEEIEAVKFVLKRFFVKNSDGRHHQKRISEEIESYHSQSEINKKIAIDREAKRKSTSREENGTSRERVVNDSPPNHKPLTKNQEPSTPLPPAGEGVKEELAVSHSARDLQKDFDEFWAAYPEHRKTNLYRGQSAWSEMRHHLPSQDELMHALEAFKHNSEWKKENGKMVPSPHLWLSEKRWLDAPAYKAQKKPSGESPRPLPDIDEDAALSWLRDRGGIIEQIPVDEYKKPFAQWPDYAQSAYLKTLTQKTK